MAEMTEAEQIRQWYLEMDVANLKKALKYEPSYFEVTPEYNEQYLYGVENYDRRYLEKTDLGEPLVHPGLILNQANLTRSPSFKTYSGIVSVHTRSEVEFFNPGRVGQKFKVFWEFSDMYKHNDKLYSIVSATVQDENGIMILRRHDHGITLFTGDNQNGKK